MISTYAVYEGTFMVVSHAFHPQEKRCTLFRRSSGPLENLLLQQNGENMLLQGSCVYNYNHKCEVLQIKTMTEGYDDRSP